MEIADTFERQKPVDAKGRRVHPGDRLAHKGKRLTATAVCVENKMYCRAVDDNDMVATTIQACELIASKVTSSKEVDRYLDLGEDVKHNLFLAVKWARKTLRDLEGKGHEINVVADRDGMVVCSFAKPEWPGDHSGSPMPTASEAVCMAVCEYLTEQEQ